MTLPELREWTLIRLSYALNDRVIQGVVATGHVFNRIHAYDGQLILTTRLKEIRQSERTVQTLNTVYVLTGESCRLERWSAERYDWTWQRANYDFQTLSQIEGVEPFPDELLKEIKDTFIVRIHNTQTKLLAILNMAMDIDNGLGKIRHSPDISLVGALGVIAQRTANVDFAVNLAFRAKKAFVNEFADLVPIEECPDYPPLLALPEPEGSYAARRLIPLSESADYVSRFLPGKFGPWTRSAWFFANNPNFLDLDTPLSMLEKGQVEEAAKAAKAFPAFSIALN